MLKKQAMLMLEDNKLNYIDLNEIKNQKANQQSKDSKSSTTKYASGAEVLTSHGFVYQFLPSAGRILVSYIKIFLYQSNHLFNCPIKERNF